HSRATRRQALHRLHQLGARARSLRHAHLSDGGARARSGLRAQLWRADRAWHHLLRCLRIVLASGRLARRSLEPARYDGAVLFRRLVPRDRRKAHDRARTAEVPLATGLAIAIFCLFIVIALCAGLVFNIVSVALPKIMDERLGADLPLVLVGGLASAVFMCGAIAQVAVGRLVERFPPHILFAVIASLQFLGVLWAAQTSGKMLLLALAVAMAAIYAQVTVNDLVIARYTADAWRGRVYAVRYFLTFIVSGAAVSVIAILYARGGFDLVLGATAAIALGFVLAPAGIALWANSVEKGRAGAPAE